MSEEIFGAIRESSLLSALTDRQIHQLASIATVRQFSDGEKLISQGTQGALAMWVILDGEVVVSVDGKELATMGRGSHLGEMAVLSNTDQPRSADVVASGTVRAVRVAKWDLLTFIKNNEDVAMAIIAELARRLEDADRR